LQRWRLSPLLSIQVTFRNWNKQLASERVQWNGRCYEQITAVSEMASNNWRLTSTRLLNEQRQKRHLEGLKTLLLWKQESHISY
jgi:hypothetical protein